MTNTLFVGKVYLRFDELPSTNDYARELLAKSEPAEGTVIRADSQSAGRGQFGSQWSSSAGANLTLSIIFYPNWLAATVQFRLSEAVALALFDTVSNSIPADLRTQLKIKWPNDLYLGSRKTAGILIQNSLSGNFIQSSVVGIGLNVNQTEFPAAVPNATSLALATGQWFELDSLASTLFACIERRYFQLKTSNPNALREEYQAHLFGKGEHRLFGRTDGTVFTGVLQHVQEDGRLVIKTETGSEVFSLKEIKWL